MPHFVNPADFLATLGKIKQFIAGSRIAKNSSILLKKLGDFIGVTKKIEEKTGPLLEKISKNNNFLARIGNFCYKSLGILFDIVTSIRTMRLAILASIIAVFAFPPAGAVFSTTIFAISLTSMVIQTMIDSYRVYKLEKKAKESKLIAKYINSRNQLIEQIRDKKISITNKMKEYLADKDLAPIAIKDINSKTPLSRINRTELAAEISRLYPSKKIEDIQRVKFLVQKQKDIDANMGFKGSDQGLRTCLRQSGWGLITSSFEGAVAFANMGFMAANPLQAATVAFAAIGNYIGVTINIHNSEVSMKAYQQDIEFSKTRPDIPEYSTPEELRIATVKLDMLKHYIVESHKRGASLNDEIFKSIDYIKPRNKFFGFMRELGKNFIREFNPFAKAFVIEGNEKQLTTLPTRSLDIKKEEEFNRVIQEANKIEPSMKVSILKNISTFLNIVTSSLIYIVYDKGIRNFFVTLSDVLSNSFMSLASLIKNDKKKSFPDSPYHEVKKHLEPESTKPKETIESLVSDKTKKRPIFDKDTPKSTGHQPWKGQ